MEKPNNMEEKKLSKKEIARRKRLRKLLDKKREAGLARYYKRIHKEKLKREALKKKQKEKEREKKRKAREKAKEKAKKKKRVGRPKKSGPKVNYYQRYKKKKELALKKAIERPKLPPFKYEIISCRNGIQNKFIGKYRTIDEAYDVFNALKNEDNNVIFPTMVYGWDTLENAIDEYILIEESDSENTLLRNEYGKLVEQKTNVDGWIVLDKFRYKKEETFWVYGYHKRNDRKTITWIYNHIIQRDDDEFLYDYKRIILYKNKIVIKHDNGEIDLIFCKCPNDGVRFYNMLEKWVKRDRLKNIIFVGDYSEKSDRRKKLEEELMEFTGWSKKKVCMNGTSYFIVNKNKKLE